MCATLANMSRCEPEAPGAMADQPPHGQPPATEGIGVDDTKQLSDMPIAPWHGAAETGGDEASGSDLDSSDDDMLEELDEELPNSLVCYICFKKKHSNSKSQTVALLQGCMDYRHPTKLHRACMDGLSEKRCIYCDPEIKALGDVGLCKLVVRMASRALGDRDVLFRALYEMTRLTNSGEKQVAALHEFGACRIVLHALSAWPSDLPFCLRAMDAVIALCQLPKERASEAASLCDAAEVLVEGLRTYLSDPEACIKAMTAITKLAILQHHTIAKLEQAGACPLIAEAMRRHKEKHTVQMTGMEAIRALSDHNLGPGSAVVSSKLVQIFFDTMLRYGKDRSIQLFCLEALCELSSDGVSASTLGAHDACRCASMPLASFKADLEVQRAGCRVLTRLCMHNPHCHANRDKLLRLKSAALVTRALKSFGKDKPLVLDALATAATLATPSEPTAVTAAAGFGEVGFLEVAVCVAEGLEGDGEVFGAMVQALAALVAANVANQPRLLELEDPLLDMLKQGRKKVGSDDRALLEQVDSLIRLLEPAAQPVAPAPPKPAPASDAPPASPRDPSERRSSNGSKPLSIPPLPSPRALSPVSSTGPPTHRSSQASGTISPRSQSTPSLPPMEPSSPSALSPRDGPSGHHKRSSSLSSTGGSSAFVSTSNGLRSPSATSSTQRMNVGITPASTITESQLPELNATTSPRSHLHTSQLQAGLERLAEAEAAEAEEVMSGTSSLPVTLPEVVHHNASTSAHAAVSPRLSTTGGAGGKGEEMQHTRRKSGPQAAV